MQDNINVPHKGMVKDIGPIQQSDKTTRFTLNGIYSNVDGRVATVQTENGNSICYRLSEGYTIVGHVNMSRDEVLIISTNGTLTKFGSVSKDCNYNPLITTSCVTTNICKYKKGLFRILKGCERIVYLYDGEEYDLSINIDDLQSYTQTYEVVENGKTILRRYTVDEANAGDLWDCNQMKLEPDFIIPCIESVQVVEGGGSMELGKWRFALEVLDSDLNRIGISSISQGVDIWDESLTENWDTIDGGYNLSEEFTAEAGGVPVTNKAIQLNISNIDQRFTYIRVHAIVKRTGGGETIEVYSSGNLITIGGETDTFIYTGVNPSNGDTVGSLIDLTTVREKYKSSGAMEFVDRRLVRGNLTTIEYDYGAFQRAASAIGTTYTIKEVEAESMAVGESKNPITPFDSLSLMGDEIEPHAIVYEFSNGQLSPPFHIPGRPPNKGSTGIDLGGAGGSGGSNCIVVRGWGPPEPPGCTPSTWQIEWTVDGGPVQIASGEMEAGGEVSVWCGEGTIEIISWTTVIDCTPVIQYFIEPDGGFVSSGNPAVPVTNEWDYDIITTWFEGLRAFGYTDEAAYNSLPDDQKLKNWEVYNTAYKLSELNGELAYYECPNDCYPELFDCDGNDIWGNDICGNPLVNTPIRHIKLPDRCLEPHMSLENDIVRILGLNFTNVTYPHPDIVGHHFVRAKKDSTNKTVLSAGWTSNVCLDTSEDDDYIGISYARNPTSEHNQYLSAETLIEGYAITGTYAKETLVAFSPTNYIVQPEDNDIQEAAVKYGGDDLQLGARVIQPLLLACEQPFYYQVERNVMVGALSKTAETLPIVNLLWDNKMNYLRYDREAGGPITFRYTTLKSLRRPYCNLDSIQYYRGHSCKFDSPTAEVYTGSTYISELTHWRTVLSDIDSNNQLNPWVILGIVVSAALAVVTAGVSVVVAAAIAAAGITAVGVAAIVSNLKEGKYEACRKDQILDGDDGGSFGIGDGFTVFNSEYLRKYYIESEYNFDMVHSGTSEYTRRFKDYNDTSLLESLKKYSYHKCVFINDEDKEEARDLIIPEVYLYNRDFNGDQIGNVYIPLGRTFDYCTDCIEKKPNSIVWSERSFEREIADANRIFLALNTTEIGSHAGAITNIKYDRNRMIITTENSAFALAPNPRTLQTDAEQVYTGVGDFLSIPEQEFVKTTYGYGGCQTMYGAVNTPFGWIYPDEEAGEIFLYGSSLERLSDKGMRHWFKENLPGKLKAILTDWDLPFDCYDNISKSGVGVMATFDPRYSRYILHKRDFTPLNFKGDRYVAEIVGLYYDGTDWYYNTANQITIPVTFGDPEYFKDESWTISYSFVDQAWASFHSYLPTYLYNDHDTFTTYTGDHEAWVHGDFNYTNYYGKKYDFIIEYVLNNSYTNDLHALHWYSQSKIWDSTHQDWVERNDITFDRMLIRNSCQSTGLQQLTYLDKNTNPYGNRIGWSNTEKDVVRIEKDYKVSGIRDLSNSQPLITDNWAFIVNQWIANGYIDYISLDNNIDYDRNQHHLPDLKDKYHIVRLYANPEEDASIELNLVNSVTFASIH